MSWKLDRIFFRIKLVSLNVNMLICHKLNVLTLTEDVNVADEVRVSFSRSEEEKAVCQRRLEETQTALESQGKSHAEHISTRELLANR